MYDQDVWIVDHNENSRLIASVDEELGRFMAEQQPERIVFFAELTALQDWPRSA